MPSYEHDGIQGLRRRDFWLVLFIAACVFAVGVLVLWVN